MARSRSPPRPLRPSQTTETVPVPVDPEEEDPEEDPAEDPEEEDPEENPEEDPEEDDPEEDPEDPVDEAPQHPGATFTFHCLKCGLDADYLFWTTPTCIIFHCEGCGTEFGFNSLHQ